MDCAYRLEDGAFDILLIIPITALFRLLKRAIAFFYPLYK